MVIYFLSIVFTLLFVIYQKWQFSDDRGKTQGKWHTYGMFLRLWFFIALFVTKYYPSEMEDFVLAGAINIVLWEVGVNIFSLNEKWNHVGTTSVIDVKLGKKKWWIFFGMLGAAVAFKLLSS